MSEIKWEQLSNEHYEFTERAKVDGGYIYRSFPCVHGFRVQGNTTMCFVPDVDLSRYQAHLRDAYKQGYRAGQEDASLGVITENA